MPIAREGWPFILPPLTVALLARARGWRRVAAVGAGAAGFMAFFFRDPERTAPPVPGVVLAPADGRVVEVRPALEDPFVGPARQVSIFLSPLDVHVNRAPVAGRVVAVEHRPGEFLAAYRAEASLRNERTAVSLQADWGRVVVRQVAGVLARRIVCRVRPGDTVTAGQRYGMIRFGSRTDLVVPERVRVTVAAGDRVRGGETIVGVLG
jgi:phosphatidylserine decarboxylase